MSFLNLVLENTQNSQNAKAPALSIVKPATQADKVQAIRAQYSGTEITKGYGIKDSKVFSVDSLVLGSEEHGPIEGKRGLFVGNKCINIVSDRYEVHQPTDIINSFTKVADACNLKINKILTNPNNGGVLINAEYGGCKIAGEDHNAQINFFTSHCGKYRTIMSLDYLRMACMNQIPALYKAKEKHIFSLKHYKGSLDLGIIESQLSLIPEAIAEQCERATLLQQTPMSFNDFMDLFTDHAKLEPTAARYDNKVNELRNIYNNEQGQTELSNSAYKAQQAVTFYNTHAGRETSYKEENQLFTKRNDSLKFQEVLLSACGAAL